MSNAKDNEAEPEEVPEFTLTQAVEDVSKHGYAQAVALQEKEKILNALQLALADVKKVADTAEEELRSCERESLQKEGEIQHLEQETKALIERIVSISNANSKLQYAITDEEESARTVLAGFDDYRKKMEAHRAAVEHAEKQTEAHKELEEKRELVRKLTQKREELREDLENPCGNTVQMEKREIDGLEEEVFVRRKATNEMREKLKDELVLHVTLQKDIEIQNKRYEAILRRLHCQTSRIQASHRELCEEIFHMEIQLEELKRQQKSKEDSGCSQ